MAQYIDKAAVVAEIEKRKWKLLDHIICERDKEWACRTAHQLNKIKFFIDTLEVKEVDLEKEKDDYWDKLCNSEFGELLERDAKWFDDIAKHFFELGLKAQKGE